MKKNYRLALAFLFYVAFLGVIGCVYYIVGLSLIHNLKLDGQVNWFVTAGAGALLMTPIFLADMFLFKGRFWFRPVNDATWKVIHWACK